MVAGFEIELLADALQLVHLGLFEAIAVGAEHGCRVHHAGVQQLFKQRIAQVVMRANVALRALAGVAVEPVQCFHQWTA
ncbi:hypothetical protein D3C76_1562020 [compost metagenome]